MTDPLLPTHLSGSARAVLRPILISLPLGLLAVLLAGGGRVSALELLGPAILIVAALSALYCLAVGRVRAASALIIVSLIGCGLSTIVGYGSVRSVGFFAFIGAVVVAGIFHERRVLISTVLCTAVVIGALVYAEITGLMTSLNRPVGVFHGLTMGITLALIGFAVHYSRTVAILAADGLERELRERAQAEATIRRTEERLRLSMEATRQGWFDLDIPSGAVLASDHFIRMVGANPSKPDMSQQTWIASIHPDDRVAVLEVFQECLESGDTRQMEYRMRTSAGDSFWIRSIAKVVQWDDQGRPVRMTGTHTDITDQMQVTMALRQSERQHRMLVERSPVAMLVQRDGIVVYANAAASTLLGARSAEELIGTPFFERVHPADRASALWLDAPGNMSNNVSTISESRFLRMDGQSVEVSVQCAPITFDGAAALELSCNDISERKRADASRLRSRQLESLGTLAGGIAHDFNNIILAIRGNAELAAAEVGEGHAAGESLHEISRASARASEIVRRITAFGRPKEPNRELIELPALIDEVLKLLRPTIPSGIAFHVQVDGDVPTIAGDAAQLHEALVNLTTNAADAIGHKNVGSIGYTLTSLRMSAEESGAIGIADGRCVRLSVADTGHGMDANTMARAFDAFYTTKPTGEGSGLGLSMVYGIIKSHEGTVVAESTPGAGSTFHLYLPVARCDEHRAPVEAVTLAPSSRSRRVLFVDDEAQLVHLANRVLTRAGHQVEGFTDPASALAVFRERPNDFDIVVTDLTMPRMSGLELARVVRDIRSDVRIAMATGDADATDASELEAAGIQFVTVKATAANQLVGLVERAFRD